MFYYSRDRAGEHAQGHLADYAGIFQADAFGGYNRLYETDRKPGQIVEAASILFGVRIIRKFDRSLPEHPRAVQVLLRLISGQWLREYRWLHDFLHREFSKSSPG